MSATLGAEWGEEQPSAERLNAKSLFVGTGDDIGDITISSPIALALCTADGSGFFTNHVYLRYFDTDTQLWSCCDDVFRKHTHADDTENEGDYYDIDINVYYGASSVGTYLRLESYNNKKGFGLIHG
jgi:hypothetical protein